METADSEPKVRSWYEEKVGQLFLDLTDRRDLEKQLRTLAMTKWSSLRTGDAIGLVGVASEDPNAEVRSLAATVLGGLIDGLLSKGQIAEHAKDAGLVLGKFYWDSDPEVRGVVDRYLERVRDRPELSALTQGAICRTIPAPGRTGILLPEDVHVEQLPNGDIIWSARLKDIKTAAELAARLCSPTQSRTVGTMTQDELDRRDSIDSTGPAENEAAPEISDSSKPAAASSEQPITRGCEDTPEKAVPREYLDWLDDDFEFEGVQRVQVRTVYARFESSGRASPSPYAFDE